MKEPFELPGWVDRNLYPFTTHRVNVNGGSLHYVDEGTGPVVLFLHGTPEWSFSYRELIIKLKNTCRCIAPDMLGFGLSDKPAKGDYTCAGHAARLNEFIHALGLDHITLVANDFGGGIGLHVATLHPPLFDRFVLFNTWCWALNENPHYARPATIMNTWLGRLLYQRLNFAVNAILPSAFANRKLLTPAIHTHYKDALPTPPSRIGTYAFALELMNAGEWWDQTWKQMDSIKQKPFLFFWGKKDKFIAGTELLRWQKFFPGSTFKIFDDAGHFVQEEKPKEMIAGISRFIHSPASAQETTA